VRARERARVSEREIAGERERGRERESEREVYQEAIIAALSVLGIETQRLYFTLENLYLLVQLSV